MYIFGKFVVLCFLVTSVLRFALLPYHRRIDCRILCFRSASYNKIQRLIANVDKGKEAFPKLYFM